MARRHNSAAGTSNIWPGFVDALATLLLVIIFLLVVFVLAQVLLTYAISGKDEALDRLNREVMELAELLNLEREANSDLRLTLQGPKSRFFACCAKTGLRILLILHILIDVINII